MGQKPPTRLRRWHRGLPSRLGGTGRPTCPVGGCSLQSPASRLSVLGHSGICPVTRMSRMPLQPTKPGEPSIAPPPLRVRVYVPAQPSIVNSPQKGPAHPARSRAEFWFSGYVGKGKERTTSAEEHTVPCTSDETELTRCDLSCHHLSVARLFFPRIQFHLLLPNNK